MLANSSAGLYDEKERELELIRGRVDALMTELNDTDALIRDQAKALMEARNDVEESKRYDAVSFGGVLLADRAVSAAER